MFGVIRKKTLCFMLAALMCFSMFPISAALLPQARALTPEDMEPMFLLMENTHQYVTEIPAGKPFAVSAYWGDLEELISVSLIDEDGSHEYVLYKDGNVYYGGREYSDEEGPYYMVDFSAAEFAPGDYYVLARTTEGDCRSNETVTILADANYKEPPAITTASLPAAKQFEAYSYTLKATPNYGGAITWEITWGNLPTGMTLNGKTGAITGTPESWGNFYITVTAAEAGGGKQTKDLTLKVDRVPVYTVSFNLAGGSPRGDEDYAARSVNTGEAFKLPAGPKRAACKFVGWRTPRGEVFLAGAAYDVQSDVTFTALWTDREPTAVSLPANLAQTAGSVWLEGDGQDHLWSDYSGTGSLSDPKIMPYNLAYRSYSSITLCGYINGERTALAEATGNFNDETESVSLTATGEKWEILKGVRVEGLEEGADYLLGAVTWTRGKQSDQITSFPCMVRPDNAYTVKLRFNANNYEERQFSADTYTVSGLTNGYLVVKPAALTATAAVSGQVTMNGDPFCGADITVSQTVGGYTRTRYVSTDIKGNYSITLIPGVPATFSVQSGFYVPYIEAGETLADPVNGKTHNVALRYVSLSAEIAVQTAGDAKAACRYLKACGEWSFLLELQKDGIYDQGCYVPFRVFSGSLSHTATIDAYRMAPEDAGKLKLRGKIGDGTVFEPTEANVRFSGGRGSVKLTPALHAGAVVSLSAASSGSYFLVWYDAAGNYIDKTDFLWLSNEPKDIAVPCPAEAAAGYTLVLMSGVYRYESLLRERKLADLSSEQAIASWKVTLKKTQIAALSDFFVDSVTSENSKFVTKPHSTLSVSKSGFSGKNELISFFGTVGMDPGFENGILTELQLTTGKDSAPSMVPQSVTVNGTSYPFEASHGSFTVRFGNLAAGGISLPCSYTIYARPYAADRDMKLELTCSVKSGALSFYGEPVGTATVSRPGASMRTVSDTLCGDTVRLNGTAKANEKVTVYDGGVAIGSAKADDSGRWQGAFPLAGRSETFTTRHTLYAVSASGVHTNECVVTHRKGGPELKDIRMWYENKGPISLGGTYAVAQSMKDVRFSAEFKNPGQLDDLPGWNSKVVLRVYLGNGDIRLLETKQEKDGTFTASIDYISGFIISAEAIYNAKPGAAAIKENTDGSLTCAAETDTKQTFADVSAILRSCMTEKNGKAVFNGKSQKDSFSVAFKNGKATLGGNAKGAAEGTTEAALKAAMESAAAELKTGNVNAENFGINYGSTQNTMEWLNAVGEEQAKKNEAAGKNAKLSYFYRTNLLSDKTSFNNAKAAVEKYAVNVAWNENAEAKNHTKLNLGSNMTFDTYVITDMQYGDDGTPESGTYFIQIEFYSDTTAKPAVYLASASVILDGGFRGYTGLRDGSAAQLKGSILSLFTVRANAWEQGIYSSFHGKYSENAAYEQYCKMESATGNASLVTGTIGSAITLTPGASKGLSAMGTYFSAAGLSASIYNLGYVLHNNGYRIHVRVFMDGDLTRLLNSPCFKRLTPAQQQMCNDAYDKFKNAAERADKIDTRITGVSVGLCGGSIAASGIGMVQKLAKPAAKAGLAISAGGVALSAGTNDWIKESFDEMTRAYEDAYNKIESIILGQSARTNSDDCKKVKRNGKDVIVYNVTFDPAGVVYEGVIENPVENALVTLWYGVDANGNPVKEADAKNVKRVIPAADVEEKSPTETSQTTGADGRYQWFVPEGLWYVTAEAGGLKGDSGADRAATVQITGTKADGKTVTKLLPVLPVQLDVNIPLTDPTAPAVESVRFTTDGIYVTFSKYMVDSAKGADSVLNPANYTVSNAGGSIAVSGVTAVEQGHTPANIDGEKTKTYTRTVLVKLKTAPKSGDELLLNVKKGVKSYAGTAMGTAYYESGTAGANAAPGAPVIAGGAKQTIAFGSPVTISLPKNAPANAEIRYTTDGTAPTADSTLYTGPVGAEQNMTIRAVTVCPGYPNSKEAKTTVTIAETLAFELAGDVITSDGGDPAGITLTVTGKNFKKTVTVAKGGSYALEDVPVGSYTVSFAGNGSYKAAEVKTEISTAAPWATLHLTATFKPGDVDADGNITAADARYTLRAAVSLDDTAEGLDFSDPANRCYRAADVDGETGISAADARLILRAAVGLETLTA